MRLVVWENGKNGFLFVALVYDALLGLVDLGEREWVQS